MLTAQQKIDLGFFFDEKANEKQREALNMIFTGQAAGFIAERAKLIGNVRGIEFAPIIPDDLSGMLKYLEKR